jgi:hypothetical protein
MPEMGSPQGAAQPEGRHLKMSVRCIILCLIFSVGRARADFYDPMVADKAKTYQYLGELEEKLGGKAWDSLQSEYLLPLAETMGPIDRANLSAEDFASHLLNVKRVKDRYYCKHPLTLDQVKADLLPLRIRYENTSNPRWMSVLGDHFADLTKDRKTADDAARVIFGWVGKNLTMTEGGTPYRLSIRGDLDPITVLKGRRGREIDLSIFTVAALRASGIAARLVWAPWLRGEDGGRVWAEYLSEKGVWIGWMPSLSGVVDHPAEIRMRLAGKAAFVMARPEQPMEITENYCDTGKVLVEASQADIQVSIMILGANGLVPARGLQSSNGANERDVMIGKGIIFVCASFWNEKYALLPIEFPADAKTLKVKAFDGDLTYETHK